MKPSLGRIVVYRSRTGTYSVAAIISCTDRTIVRENIAKGHLVDISEPGNVHLGVFTPGIPGMRAAAQDFLVPPPSGKIMENVGGTYQEFDIPQWEPDTHTHAHGAEPKRGSFDYDEQPPGTWADPMLFV